LRARKRFSNGNLAAVVGNLNALKALIREEKKKSGRREK